MDLRSLAKKWDDVSDKWDDVSAKGMAILPRRSSPGPWVLLGTFVIGIAAGAVGFYAVTQRSQLKRLATGAFMSGDEALGEFGGVDLADSSSLKSNRSDHRRKAAVEVS